MMKKPLLTFYVLICFASFAQRSERFNLVLSAGGVGSQVDGDSYGGYTKLGPFAGLYLNKAIGEKADIDFGLTYVQKGARKNASNLDPSYYIARLNYAEVPLILSMTYKEKYRFEGGLSFAYLFSKHEESSQVGTITTPFKKYDFSYNFGLGYRANEKVYFNLRYNYSLVPIRDYQQNVYLGTFWTRIFNKGLYNNVLQLTINYIISPKETTSD